MKVPLILALLLCFAAHHASGQDKPRIKFGKISPEDFKATYTADPNAQAIIIGDIGSSDFIGNSKGGFSIEFKRLTRTLVLNRNAYDDLTQVEIPVYTEDENEEKLGTLKAATYNLENGRVIETKLDPKAGMIKERLSRNLVIYKFSFPAVREGSIIEVEYKLQSDFLFRLRPWEFQDKYPTLWSEYVVGMPEFLNYVSLTQGYQQFFIKDTKVKHESFSLEIPREGVMQAGLKDRVNFSARITSFRWVMKDVPALKEESYTSTIYNHIARIEFQLSEYREPYIPQKIMNTWAETATRLMAREDFGAQLQQDNYWLNDAMPSVLNKATTSLDKAKNIYAWVRDNFSCIGSNSLYLKKSLQSTFKSRNGSEADINMVMIAMLRSAGVQADPVILSTRSNGYAYALYPLIERFNYVIARVMINGEKYYLDASRPQLGFNKLGVDCFNGHARAIGEEDAEGFELKSDSLLERSMTAIFMTNDAKGGLSANVQYSPGYYESYNIRTDIKRKGADAYIKELKRDEESVISAPVIDSLNNYEAPVSVKYQLHLPPPVEDIFYFDPMLFRSWKDNPFKSAQRLYPVEMPYNIDQTFLLRMDIPAGYIVDELPKPLVLKLNNENDGEFEYRVGESGGIVSLRCRLKINRTYFAPEEYQMLREFFNLIVKKQNEQIVFKKKK